MLVSLRIVNFVLFEDCRIEWRHRFAAITGETGAGKSVIISALNTLLGERASSESVMNPDADALIEAEFTPPEAPSAREALRQTLENAGVEWDDERLLLSRRIASNGRGRIFINNSPCLLKTLQEAGEWLVDLHGQHEHQSLLRKAAYLPLLDRFSGGGALDPYQQAWQAWRESVKALESLREDERELKRREDMLRFQRQEIDDAALEPGEDAEIESRLGVIQYAEKLSERCRSLMQSLSDGAGEQTPLLDELDRLEQVVHEMSAMDKHVSAIAELWQSALISLREASREIEVYADQLEFDPGELDRLQERRYLIKSLKSKYGDSIEEILAYRERIHAELERIEHADEERERLEAEEAKRRAALARQGGKLHKQRADAAKKATKAVQSELAALGMKEAEFAINLSWRHSGDGIDAGEAEPVAFGPNGGDDAEFLITTLPGKPPRPLRETASGGEISRIMLALKCALSAADPVPIMIFDEIDTGVGGETAEAVADRLARLAQDKQVICITHLPQIASKAQQSLQVTKEKRNGRMVSDARALSVKERESELARMLGAQDSRASQRLAREMLKKG